MTTKPAIHMRCHLVNSFTSSAMAPLLVVFTLLLSLNCSCLAFNTLTYTSSFASSAMVPLLAVFTLLVRYIHLPPALLELELLLLLLLLLVPFPPLLSLLPDLLPLLPDLLQDEESEELESEELHRSLLPRLPRLLRNSLPGDDSEPDSSNCLSLFPPFPLLPE